MIKEWKQIHITCYKYQLMDAAKAGHSLSRVVSQFSNTIHFKELFSKRTVREPNKTLHKT